MADDRALLIAMPIRHLESSVLAPGSTAVLPAGGPGDLDSAVAGMPVLVIATGEDSVPAVTWRATLVGRVAYEAGSPWPDHLPPTWVEEHPAPGSVDPSTSAAPDGDSDEDEYDEYDDDDDDEDDEVGPQSFLQVEDLQVLPRHSWLFANELVRKQARGGRTFRPRVPTLVDLPD